MRKMKETRKKGKSYVGVYGVEKTLEVAEELRVKAKKELDGFEKYGFARQYLRMRMVRNKC
ncbi:hypothetical protein SO802_027883 [Lithocarpus litseifolius]|uniref:Ribosomal protein S4 n=1 Tax=Lithocarpus litseifolius TaxID=425828 RepID=A0AAW2BRU4_9ROSI